MASPYRTSAERFWPRVNKTFSCWEWTGGKTTDGYGQFWLGDRMVGAHRFAYIVCVGPIPHGMCVLHRCDTPFCVCPSHLFLGTRTDNNADKTRKGRNPRGERMACAKLTDAAVREIRIALASGATKRGLARKYGVNPKTIVQIARGETWRHVSDAPVDRGLQ